MATITTELSQYSEAETFVIDGGDEYKVSVSRQSVDGDDLPVYLTVFHGDSDEYGDEKGQWLSDDAAVTLAAVLLDAVGVRSPVAVPAVALTGNSIEAGVQLAIDAGGTLEFRYQTDAFAVLQTRFLEPSTIVTAKDGTKSVVGHDPDRNDVRAFRLDRIVNGSVKISL